jgi:hypothetical protein
MLQLNANIINQFKVEIILEHAEFVVGNRSVSLYSSAYDRTPYHINRHIKAAAVYYFLKSLSTSGAVSRRETGHYARALSWTTRTFNKWLSQAKELGYLSFSKDKIFLKSFRHVSKIYGVSAAKRVTVTLNKASDIVTAIEGAEMHLNQQKQRFMFDSQLKKNRNLQRRFVEHGIGLGAEGLVAQQMEAFRQKRSEISDVLFELNPDVHRNARTMADRRCLKNWGSISELKARLILAGLANVEKRAITSKSATYSRRAFTLFNRETRERTTIMPDAIRLKNFFHNQ